MTNIPTARGSEIKLAVCTDSLILDNPGNTFSGEAPVKQQVMFCGRLY